MRREVEGDGKAFLTSGEIGAVESIRFFGGREAGILPHRPRLGEVHGRIRPPQKGREARPFTREVNAVAIVRSVERLDLNAFGRRPDSLVSRIDRLRGDRERNRREVGDLTHEVTIPGAFVSTPMWR